MRCGVMWRGAMSCDVVWCDALSCLVMWRVMWHGVMWCNVLCWTVMWCDDVLSCNVIWWDVTWSDVKWCNGMGFMWLWCYVAACEDMWCDAMWLCDVVNWEMVCCELWRADDSKPCEIHSNAGWNHGSAELKKYGELMPQYYRTPYYNLNYSVLQRTSNYDIHAWQS